MSLEAALTANTEALARLSTLMEEGNKARDTALAAINAGAAENGAASPGRPTAAAKAAAKAEADAKKAEAAAKAAPKEATADELRAAAVAFNSPKDEADKPARKDFMKAVMDELGIEANAEGKRVIVGAKPEDRQKIIDWFAEFAAGKKVNFSADDGEAPEAPVVDDDDIG